MSEFILEIFSEEIPARMQTNACMDLRKLFSDYCDKVRIGYHGLEVFVTPRRLVLYVEKLAYLQKDSAQEKRGPRVGADQRAISSFAISCNLEINDLKVRDVQGTEYYFASVSFDGSTLKKEITQIVEKILASFPWPKTMRWDSSNVIWVRPIRNILCILSGEVLPVKFGHLTANNQSYGHRFLSPGSFDVEKFSDYRKKLNDHKVILDAGNRRVLIEKQIGEITDRLKLELIVDENLLNEVVGLVEYPVALIGKIEDRFLGLPREILVTTIRVHQKFFSLRDRNGDMAPYFITIANNDPQDKSLVVAGNETVLRARLCDAEFFFNEDKKTPLVTRVPNLKNVIFHKKLGTVLEKTERMVEVSGDIAKLFGLTNIDLIKRSSLLSKADLTTNIVGEFAELQGIAGKYYATHDQESSIVAETIADHYLPRGRYDQCPALIESAIVAIADKLDSIVGLFFADEAPTSSKDPYGLRRNALGIIRILVESKLNVNLRVLLDYAVDSYEIDEPSRSVLKQQIEEFFIERFKFFIKDLGGEYATVLNAVMNRSETNFYSDYNKITVLTEYINSESGKLVYSAVKRTKNILKDLSKPCFDVDEGLLISKLEKEIFEEMVKIEKNLDTLSDKFDGQFRVIEKLAVLINDFFDSTMVMVDDEKICENRIILLTRVAKVLNINVDFTVIE